MQTGLENFEKFTNKMVISMARQGRLTRSGETRNAAVMFVFIRDFEEKWENFDAKEVVTFLNKFLAAIVPAITATGGIVDKFLTQGGVIVMAVWGTLARHGPEENAAAAVHSVLLIREAMTKFNKQRETDPNYKVPGDRRLGQRAPFVRVAAAVNCGELVAGQIGGEDRLEYTVIGDTVNLAARLEGPNDLFNTDNLISENVYNLLHEKITAIEMPGLEVKGKSEPLRTWTVLNSGKCHGLLQKAKALRIFHESRSG
jgi:adenylate cyclase